MKKVIKFKTNYIFGSLLGLIGIGLPFLVFFLIKNNSSEKSFSYPILMASIAALYIILAMVLGDLPLIIYKYKHREEYDPLIPEEIKEKGLRFRIPFVIGAILVLTTLGILGIIYLASGNHWPLL